MDLSAPFILLDDARRQGVGGLLFAGAQRWIIANHAADVPAALVAMQEAQQQGFYLAGACAYELGYCLEAKLLPLLQQKSATPLLVFGVFATPQKLSPAAVADLLCAAGDSKVENIVPQLDAGAYLRTFKQAQNYIHAGDIYQANLTFPLRFSVSGHPAALYRQLRSQQRGKHQALLHLPDGRWVLSLSPELFVQNVGDQVTTKPMKGTAARQPDALCDLQAAKNLARDIKTQAENLMIVDLLRNDLARVAQAGSVQVSALYETETYPTLHQLTSTVTAKLRADQTPQDLLRALFPCGSVTGAPKIRAQEIIAELETAPRDFYCGAIGMITPQGDVLFNVAIRTLTIKDGQGVMGIGSAVVADSSAIGEYDECLLKAKFLTQTMQQFDLLETMRWSATEGFYLLDRHMARLAQSARYFDYTCDQAAISAALAAVVVDPKHDMLRVRLLLAANGELKITTEPLVLLRHALMTYVYADRRTDSRDVFHYHKTTNRSFYDDEYARLWGATGCDEIIFLNERGEVTEGSRTNVFVRFGDQLFTPPLQSGLHDGCLRQALFDDLDMRLTERVLFPADLAAADEVLLGNSVRGLLRAELLAAGERTAVSA